jgi:hypothetical protein
MDEKQKALAAEVMKRMLQTPPTPFTPQKAENGHGEHRKPAGRRRARSLKG